MEIAALQITLAKAVITLQAMLLVLHPVQPTHISGKPTHFGGSSLTSLQTTEMNNLATKGKYVYVPPTKNADGSISTVNTFLYPDKTQGYQILTTSITNVQMASGTTPVQHISSVGVGEDSVQNTWSK